MELGVSFIIKVSNGLREKGICGEASVGDGVALLKKSKGHWTFIRRVSMRLGPRSGLVLSAHSTANMAQCIMYSMIKKDACIFFVAGYKA